ncbi:MAG: RDD family protein [Candidatus Hodarchaeales archaeon]|jgi:uncharacterized RDD family membrane protein YckC
MTELNEKQEIYNYIDEISRLLPYPKSLKEEVLNDLKIDVQSALDDSIEKSPTKVFGTPVEVANNVIHGQEWYKNRAGWKIRFMAWGIDLFLKLGLGFLILAIGFIIMILFVPLDELLQEFSKWETSSIEIILSSTTGQLVTILSFLVIVPATMVFFLYNIVLEYYFSATVGKKLFRLVTVDHSGLKMQGRQVIIRNLSKIVLGEFLILDTVLGMILERQTPERTHYQRGLDILAETIVIKV